MSRPRSSVVIAMIGALVLALPLAACGRKGPLNPPPGSSEVNKEVAGTPAAARGEKASSKLDQPDYDENERPIAPRGKKRKLPIDWLID